MNDLATPIHWRKATIADTGDYINGVAFKDSDWHNAGLPIIRIQNLTDESKPFNRTTREVRDGSRIENGDILVSWSATLDAFRWNRGPAVLNQHIFKVQPKRDVVDDRFLFYLLKEAIAEMRQSAHLHGSTMKHINRGPFLAHEVYFPPNLDEQRAIVEAIETQFARLDDAVAALERTRTRLKRYRASVLKAACEGRLVPTEAELARQEGREYEPASVLLERIKAERDAVPGRKRGRGSRADMESAPTEDRGSLPEGWEWTTLGDCFGVYVGATPSRKEAAFWGGDIPWVSSGEVAFCTISSTRESITPEGLRRTSTELHPQGTVLIGMIGEGKTRGQVAMLGIPACNNQNSAAIRVSETSVPPWYVYRYLEGGYEETRSNSSGNNQPALNKARVQAIPLPLPPLAEAIRIVSEVERVISIIDQMEVTVEASLRRAESLRQAILRQAFRGDLA